MTLAAFLLNTNFPYSAGAVYNWSYAKRVNWLSRTAPSGTRSRALWVDVPLAMEWAAERGLQVIFFDQQKS